MSSETAPASDTPKTFGDKVEYPATPALKPRKPFVFTEARKKAFFERCRPALAQKMTDGTLTRRSRSKVRKEKKE